MKPVTLYRIVKILDEKSIVINCGRINNIDVGDMFYIQSNETETVIDPFTKKKLGEITKYKAKIEAVEVFPNMCICQNSQKTGSMSNLALGLSEALVGRRLDLNVDPSQISGSFRSEDELIQIGDYVLPIRQHTNLLTDDSKSEEKK